MGGEPGAVVTWGLLALVVVKEVVLPTGRALVGRVVGRSEAAAEAVPSLAAKLDAAIVTLMEVREAVRAIPKHETRISIVENEVKRLDGEVKAVRDRYHDRANALWAAGIQERLKGEK